jgi:hypothetical protein
MRNISDKCLVHPEYQVGLDFLVLLVDHCRLVVLAGLVGHSVRVIPVVHRVLERRCHRVDLPILRHLLVQVRQDYLVSFVLVDLVLLVLHHCLVRRRDQVGHSVLEVQVGRCYRVFQMIQVFRDCLVLHLVQVDLVDQVGMDCMVEFRFPRKQLAVDQDDRVHLELLDCRDDHLRLVFQHDLDDRDDNILRSRLDV